MTHTTIDPEILEEASEELPKEEKPTLPPQKISRFGPAGFQNGSKFGKGPAGNSNPQLKQRPGRAAARGR